MEQLDTLPMVPEEMDFYADIHKQEPPQNVNSPSAEVAPLHNATPVEQTKAQFDFNLLIGFMFLKSEDYTGWTCCRSQ